MQQGPTGSDVLRVLARATREGYALLGEATRPARVVLRRRTRRLRRRTERCADRLWDSLEAAGRVAGARAARSASAAADGLGRLSTAQVAGGTAVVLLAGVVGWQRCGVSGCPAVGMLAAYQPGNAPLLLDRGGGELTRLRLDDGIPLPLDSVPEHVRAAFVAVEDQRFRSHHGVDWRRVPGALLANLGAGEVRQGFSTITMQLARNAFPERLPRTERTLRRKLLEIRVAGEIEARFGKDEILELYLNHVYFGDGVRGIRAASRHWFGKDPFRLTLEEGALLAGLLRAPEHYHPTRHPDRARQRRNLVLALMADQGRVESEEAARAAGAPLRVVGRTDHAREDEEPAAPYFVAEVRRLLVERFGEDLWRVPLRVRTTLDPLVQRAVERELERQLGWIEVGGYGRFRGPRRDPGAAPGETTPYLQGAAVVLHAATGDVLALVGGRDFRQSTFDRALRGRRQVGSAFKPFVYAAALAQGIAPGEPLPDLPLEVEVGDSVWEPRNFDGRHRGRVTVREALVHSLNVPTVLLAARVGTDRIGELAEASGIAPEVPRQPSMALGTVSTSPLDLATAYTALASDGMRAVPRFVISVEDSAGRVLWRSEAEGEPVLSPEVARGVTAILSDAVDRGTGRSVRLAGFRGPAAGKTGTTSDGIDAWFVGYTPEMVGAVWIGFDTPRPIVRSASGGLLAAPVWGRAFARIELERGLGKAFAEPQGEEEDEGLVSRLKRLLDGLFEEGE